ncbi:circadian-associated transcriptional repressor [Chanos chanos]|uniref:Circadian-associated transcriptional repressor n=1 Tax=Chanos chanos TaxID=29144 RepID=A0A6J2W9H1_CHACN|nr:circadian-associated transcriptional repressor-like [Chanos chanos]
MQSTGSTSSQPVFDSLSSGDSFLASDTEDSDVFLSEGEVAPGNSSGRSSRGAYSLDGAGVASPGSQWACDGFNDPNNDSERSEVTGHRTSSMSTSVSSSSGAWSGTESERGRERAGETEGDLLFARKCSELQGFVRPLLELLNGLKKGRFDKGLSSFQQSVAMDRIQRIVGVLQKPHIGERYLPTLLQVEMMLKLWFPQVCPTAPTVSVPPPLSTPNSHSSKNSQTTTPVHKHRDQRHIPVKKRRLSWSDTDSSSAPSPPPVLCKRFQVKGEVQPCHRLRKEEGEGSSSAPPPRGPNSQPDEEEGERSGCEVKSWSEPNLTWVHVAPIFSPPKSCPSHENYLLLAVTPPTSRDSPVTQDSFISSTTPSAEPTGCQSQPVTTETPKPSHGPPPITSKPSSRAELEQSTQSPLQT